MTSQRTWKQVEIELRCPICREEIFTEIDLEITAGRAGNPVFPKAEEGHVRLSVRSPGFYESHYCDPELFASEFAGGRDE